MAASQQKLNDLNAAARADLMRYAEADQREAFERLRQARQALTAFRSRTSILDPNADIQGQMGVISNLQQQLAEALIKHDLLVSSASEDDPRMKQARRRIEVIRNRLAEEREAFSLEGTTGPGSDYPTLIAEYEGLVVDREYAEKSYLAAQAALDFAREKATRQSLYLALYIEPTLAQKTEYPRRFVLLGLAALFAGLIWSIAVLIYYSLRDHG